ncbi:hypothetical protein WR164_06900 [Philodulcilactobacillus myokoensis]|uniref:DUF1027 domain-containing protein n=1 Tax=Philodulcilactobacillus myokoensis TaxID=2929573 RepID=A0A9W6B1B8_9LACO|nr:YutD family protein [Philodulcilactobacillus myokoensis]GLB46711.1 hypothetical protein WR164_06900 [Philodulcilactobacillus myokoensis]
MNRKSIEELIEENVKQERPLADVKQLTENKLTINGHHYEIVANPSDSFEIDQFQRKYNPMLSKYDFIVGDISFDQLRLKGFYADSREVNNNGKISSLQDYLMEYCNFGVHYYVLCNLEVIKKHFVTHRKKRLYQNGKKFKIKGKHIRIRRRVGKRRTSAVENKRGRMVVTKSKGRGRHHFTIRQKKVRK